MEPKAVHFQSRVRRAGKGDAAQPDETDEFKSASFGKIGAKAQMTLAIRYSSGRGRVFPYAQLLGIDFEDEATGFRLEFPGEFVEVSGRNLTRLLAYVCAYRAARIYEASPQQSLAASETAEIVDSIVVRRAVVGGVSARSARDKTQA